MTQSPPTVRDPFYSVKDKVQSLVATLRIDIERWEKMPINSTDYATTTKQLKQQVNAILIDVNDLAQTINIVEENRSRFASIDDRELDSRRDFVNNMKGLLAGYQAQLKKARQRMDKEKGQQDNRNRSALLESSTGGNGSRGKSRFDNAIAEQENSERNDFVNNARSQQQELESKQDIVLGDMSDALSRLQNLSSDINVELKTHEQMLNELDTEMDEAQSNMNIVLKKLDKLLRSSDKGRICCILVLFGIVVILFFLIVYG